MHSTNYRENTDKFITKYCQAYLNYRPRTPVKNAEVIESRWQKLREEYQYVYQDEIKRYFKKRYGNRRRYRKGYLTTYWWYVISHKRKLMDRFMCAVIDCGSKDNLQVHHWGYEHMGEEVKFMDDIVTLCESCHNKQHPDMKKRVLREKKAKKVVDLKDFHEKIEVIKERQQFVITIESLSTDELWEIIQRDFDTALDVIEKNAHVH